MKNFLFSLYYKIILYFISMFYFMFKPIWKKLIIYDILEYYYNFSPLLVKYRKQKLWNKMATLSLSEKIKSRNLH